MFSQRRAYAAKFAGISFWTNACLSYSSVLYLRFIGSGASQRIEDIALQHLPDLALDKLKFLAEFDGFSHIGFVVTTFFQTVLFVPMTLLFLAMHLRASHGERVDRFFPSYSHLFWVGLGGVCTFYVIYLDTLVYDATVKIFYFTIWPIFPMVSAILGVFFQFLLVAFFLLITGYSKIEGSK